MKRLLLKIDDREIEGVVAPGAGVLWVHLDGETYTYEPPARGRKTKAASVQNAKEITAPMPGKIIKILASKGAAVTLGQVLLVMEAMKMEYTLKAQAPGQVVEVLCTPGEQVALGKLLIRLDDK